MIYNSNSNKYTIKNKVFLKSFLFDKFYKNSNQAFKTKTMYQKII